jgi:hypothetical protein
MIETIGYIGTIIVLISFTFKDVKKLRIVNTIGCYLFVVYGIGNNDIPIIVSNGLISIINFTQLYKSYKLELRTKKYKL